MISLKLDLVGNTAHAINIALVLCYGITVLGYGETFQDSGILDSRWYEEGFCKPESTSADQMHLDSGIALSIFACPLLLFSYFKARGLLSEGSAEKKDTVLKESATVTYHDYIRNATVGVVGHTLGHFIIMESIRFGIYPDGDTRGIDDLKKDSIWLNVVKIFPSYVLFWIPLIKSYMQNASWRLATLVAFIAVFGGLHLQLRFGFAYTQCFLFLSLSVDQLLCVPTKKKDSFAFAAYPLITVIPSILFSWKEASSCSSSPLMRRYGHVVYDSWMGFSYALYIGACHVYYTNVSEVESKLK